MFKNIAGEVVDDLKNGIFIAHNAKFDINFLKTEIERAGYAFEIGGQFCTMKYFENIIKLKGKYGKYKWPKLEETMQFLNINTESKGFNEGLQRLYGDDVIGFHDARFDVAGLITVYYKAMKMGYEM
jgi:DNA polymerase III epsilon subunit-like protein